MNHLRHQNYKSERLKTKHKKKNRFPKLKKNPLKLEKDFKPINVSVDDMDKFEEQEITKKRTFLKKALGETG